MSLLDGKTGIRKKLWFGIGALNVLFTILAAGTLVGPVVGIVLLLLLTMIVKGIAAISSLPASVRNIFSILAYAHLPVLLSVIVILPVEILTFGLFMFTKAPTPFMLKPISAVVLFSLDGAFAAWSLVLFSAGMKSLFDAKRSTVVRVVGIALFLYGGLLCAFTYFLAHLP